MSLFIESIRVDQGVLQNLPLHQARVKATMNSFFPGMKCLNLQQIFVPPQYRDGVYKCRLVYGEDWEKVSYERYVRKHISRLALVGADNIDYSYKYANRLFFDGLFSKFPACHEFILVKNGLLTDTTYSNIAFFDGRKWHTPSGPLLKGIRRSLLLQTGMLSEKDISPGDIRHFSHVALINAMLDLGDMVLDMRETEIDRYC